MIYGTAYDEALGDRLRVTVIATGLSSARKQQGHGGRTPAPPLSVVQQPVQQLRTGTDNLPILSQVAQPNGAAGTQATPPQRSDEGLNTPTVWRSARGQAAAKVDALASNGMDEIERARRDARGEAPIRTRSCCADRAGRVCGHPVPARLPAAQAARMLANVQPPCMRPETSTSRSRTSTRESRPVASTFRSCPCRRPAE